MLRLCILVVTTNKLNRIYVVTNDGVGDMLTSLSLNWERKRSETVVYKIRGISCTIFFGNSTCWRNSCVFFSVVKYKMSFETLLLVLGFVFFFCGKEGNVNTILNKICLGKLAVSVGNFKRQLILCMLTTGSLWEPSF